MTFKHLIILSLFVFSLTACEQPVLFEDPQKTEDTTTGNVTLNITVPENISFENADDSDAADTRTAKYLSDVCTHLNLVVYDGDSKVRTINQKKGDNGFGTVTLQLPEGTYQIVILGHSCDGNATFTALDKISFPNNRVSDTFYYYGTLTVDSEEDDATHDLTLERAVAMFRLVITDDMPSNVRKMKFYYTGGSSTFSALSGRGSVNSRQTVNMDVNGEQMFEVYTFPHDNTGKLKMTVTALDASDNIVQEHIFEDVPIQLNHITNYKGEFFGNSNAKSASGSVRFIVDDEWAATDEYTF